MHLPHSALNLRAKLLPQVLHELLALRHDGVDLFDLAIVEVQRFPHVDHGRRMQIRR